MDPASIALAITAASKAFGAIKKGFAMGREIESMGKDLSRWMTAVSDIDNTEKSAKNASPLRKLFKGREIEASAIEAFTAKKKLEAQRQELKSFINFHYGANSWNEILRMEAEIRKKRKEEIYARQELIRKIWEYIAWFLLFCTIIGFIVFIAYLWKEKRG
jgi:hypothetical protein|tara:strand:- start:251 stop:733 length:483 start_codon:yes stop_codon:yes gene_type:complete